MIKKFRIFILTCFVITSSLCLSFADTDVNEFSKYQINDVDSLKVVLNEMPDGAELTEPEKVAILEEINPIVIDKFIDEKLSVLEKELDKNPMTIEEKERVIDLGDNCSVVINTEDKCESIFLPRTGILKSTPGAETLWKDFGNRQYTVSYDVTLPIFRAKFVLINHYTLGKNGITLRYGEAEIKNSSFAGVNFGDTSKDSIVEHSKKATKKGSSIKISCIYKIQYTTPVGASISKSFKLYNQVKYSDIDLSEKQVKVVQSWNGEWM